jgi:hypothetical protein
VLRRRIRGRASSARPGSSRPWWRARRRACLRVRLRPVALVDR